MAKIGTLLEKLFKKAGIDTTTEELKPIFALDTDIADDTVGKVDKSLLTLDAAKNNSDVIKAIKATTLSGADAKLDELIIELGLQPNEDFLANKNTYEKIGSVIKLANEAGKKAAGANNKQSDVDFAKKEAEYNRQLKELKDSAIAKETEFKNTRENDLTTFELKTILGSKNYIFPAEMDTNLKLSTALGAVQNELTKNGFNIKRNDAGLLQIFKSDGTIAYNEKDNVVYEPNTFIDGALAQNKLLKINDPNQQQSQQGSNGNASFIPNNAQAGNSAILADIELQMNAMK
jgi:hypothetical protein